MEFSFFFSLKVKYLGKKECDATWEPSDCIPSKIIETYHRRQETVVMSVSENYSGQTSSSLKVSIDDPPHEPPEKKTKPTIETIPDEG